MLTGSELRILRTQILGLSSREFGRKLGLSHTSVTNRETGIMSVDNRFVNRVIDTFGLSEHTIQSVKEIARKTEEAKTLVE